MKKIKNLLQLNIICIRLSTPSLKKHFSLYFSKVAFKYKNCPSPNLALILRFFILNPIHLLKVTKFLVKFPVSVLSYDKRNFWKNCIWYINNALWIWVKWSESEISKKSHLLSGLNLQNSTGKRFIYFISDITILFL